jgi:PilZ domain
MPAESRKSTRRYVRNGARIVGTDGAALGLCVMADLSSAGACLQVDAPDALPDEFILLLSHTGQLRRQCAVAWRTESSVGVKFIAGTRREIRQAVALGPAPPNP